LNPETPERVWILYTVYKVQMSRIVFPLCHLEDTMAEEAIALDSVYYGGYGLMASVNYAFKKD